MLPSGRRSSGCIGHALATVASETEPLQRRQTACIEFSAFRRDPVIDLDC